mgnify:CR=1 FL=1
MYIANSEIINRHYLSGNKTLAEISTESKISLTTIQRLLNCDRCVKYKTARRLFNYFGADSVQRVT